MVAHGLASLWSDSLIWSLAILYRMSLVIPVFIPHEGCPHDCVFCNQNSISGQQGKSVGRDEVARTIATWLEDRTGRRPGMPQVAFYGGSFTGLPASRQEDLLTAVTPFIEQGRVGSIRLSTRPDYIDAPRLALLARHRVRVVELGVQSLDNAVLAGAGRGHRAEQVELAVRLLRGHGFAVGLQLMVGLPGESCAALRRTTRGVVGLAPDFVRIYPAVVVAGSRLEAWYHQGAYRPISLQRAVLLTAFMKKYFDEHGVRVVRMGLQSGKELDKALVAGPYHPAFGEMVRSRLMLNTVKKLLTPLKNTDKKVTLIISDRDHSVFRGIKSNNLEQLARCGLLHRFSLKTDAQQPRQTVKIDHAQH